MEFDLSNYFALNISNSLEPSFKLHKKSFTTISKNSFSALRQGNIIYITPCLLILFVLILLQLLSTKLILFDFTYHALKKANFHTDYS